MALFVQILTFEKQGKSKIKQATFKDKKGKNVTIETTMNYVIPGFKYFCRIQSSFDKGKAKYELKKVRLYVDDIMVYNHDGKVHVLHNDQKVEELTYFPIEHGYYDDHVKNLRFKFIDNEFQLGSKADIETFIGEYERRCKIEHDKNIRYIKKSYKKSNFKEKIVITK